MSSKTYVGDLGTVITLDAGTNISTATTRKIQYTKPTGVTGNWTAVASGTDSIAYTTASASDLDVAGTWKLQADITTAAGHWLGETVELVVYAAMR